MNFKEKKGGRENNRVQYFQQKLKDIDESG